MSEIIKEDYWQKFKELSAKISFDSVSERILNQGGSVGYFYHGEAIGNGTAQLPNGFTVMEYGQTIFSNGRFQSFIYDEIAVVPSSAWESGAFDRWVPCAPPEIKPRSRGSMLASAAMPSSSGEIVL